MSEPIFKAMPGLYQLVWEPEQVAMQFSRFTESHGTVTAELLVKTLAPGVPSNLHYSRINLASGRAHEQVAKLLTERLNTVDWWAMLQHACHQTLESYRFGEPVQLISTTDEASPPEYLVWPIVPKNQPTIIFGDGGVGKSQLALLFCCCLITAWQDNPFGVRIGKSPVVVLYLDWETDETNIRWTLKRLRIGLNLPEFALHYRRCYFPFSDDMPEIQRLIAETGAEMLIVDSIGPAVAGDLNAAEGATRLIGRDVRKLNVTSLFLGHTAKDERGTKSVFGSVFYKNLARSVWELKKHQEVGAEKLELGLFCRKANMGPLFRPLGFEFSFFEEGIVVHKQQLKDVPELSKSLPLKDQIAALLTHAPMSAEDLAEELETTQATVRTKLNTYKETFLKLGDKWALKSHQQR